MFVNGLITFTFKSMSRFADFSGREKQSISEDLGLKWKEFAVICTDNSVFPSITTQAVKSITLLF